MMGSIFNFRLFSNIMKTHYGALVSTECAGDQFAAEFMSLLIEHSTSLKTFHYSDSMFGKFLAGSRNMAKGKILQIYNARNIRKFRYFINSTQLEEETRTALARDLKQAVKNSNMDKDKKIEVLERANTSDVAGFAFALFEYALEFELQGPKAPLVKDEKISAEYITAHSKRAVQHFIGRTDELNEIRMRLDSGYPQAIWIHGMGGLGKTQLCRKLFYDLESRFPYLGWVTVDRDFKQSIVNQVVCEKDESDMEQAYQDTLKFIDARGTNLVLFVDNVDRSGLHCEELEKLNCHVVVTSRDKAPDTFTEKALGFLSLSACKDLFYSYYKKKKDDFVNEVIHRAGYLTLAVELLAKTARNIDISVAELLAKLIDKSFDLKTVVDTNWDNDEAAQNKAVSAQFGIVFSFSGVKSDDDKIYILKNMAILPYLATRQKLLCEWLDLDDESSIFRQLYDFGWLQYSEEDGYLMHPIISYTVKAELVPSFQDCERLTNALCKAIDFTAMQKVLEVLEFTPYAQYIADYFIVEFNIKENTPSRLSLLYLRLAIVYRANGEYTLAYRYAQMAKSAAESMERPHHNFLSRIYNILATIHIDMRQLDDEGVRYAELAVKEAEADPTENPIILSDAYSNLAVLLIRQRKDFSGALKAAHRVVEISELAFQEDKIFLANAYRVYALILRKSGNPSTACEYLERCIHITEAIYINDPNHPTLATSYNNYACALQDVGRLEEAIIYYNKSIQIREDNNPNDPYLTILYNNIAFVHMLDRKYQSAADYLSLSIRLIIKTRGKKHPDLKRTHHFMAKIQFLLGEYQQALIFTKKYSNFEIDICKELERLCLICRCLKEVESIETTKEAIEEMITFKNINEIDPTGIEHYAECLEIYEKLTRD